MARRWEPRHGSSSPLAQRAVCQIGCASSRSGLRRALPAMASKRALKCAGQLAQDGRAFVLAASCSELRHAMPAVLLSTALGTALWACLACFCQRAFRELSAGC